MVDLTHTHTHTHTRTHFHSLSHTHTCMTFWGLVARVSSTFRPRTLRTPSRPSPRVKANLPSGSVSCQGGKAALGEKGEKDERVDERDEGGECA